MSTKKIVKKIKSLFKIKLKRNRWFFIFLVILIPLEVLLFFFYGGGIEMIASYFNEEKTSISGMILFEGENCSHCVTVDNFIKNNNIEDKIKFTKLEVFNNSVNASILEDKAQICGLSPSHIGVPFFWDGANCVVGYVDVIKFFQDKVAEKQ